MKKNNKQQNNRFHTIITKSLLLGGISTIASILSQPAISLANEHNYLPYQAKAQVNECYIKLAFGASKTMKPGGFYKNKLNNANYYNIGFGSHLVANNRIEINYIKFGNLNNTTRTGNMFEIKDFAARIKSEAIMLNIYSDQYVSDMIIPYFGLGLGYSKNKASFSINSLDTTNTSIILSSVKRNYTTNSFAWQFVLGINFPIHEKIAFDLSYRYSHLGKIPYPSARDTISGAKAHGKLRTQALLCGVHFKL